LQLRGLGARSSSPSGSGWSPAAKRILTHFRPKFAHFEYLMQLTDTLSHNIISHKRDTDKPITKAVNKYTVQNLSSLTEQIVLRPQQFVHQDTKKVFLGPGVQFAINRRSFLAWLYSVGRSNLREATSRGQSALADIFVQNGGRPPSWISLKINFLNIP